MRTTLKISITVPQELLEKIDHLAKEEDRSRSGFFRAAMRYYIKEKYNNKEVSKKGQAGLR